MSNAASIRWQGVTPVSTTFEDPYYSFIDPVAEVRHHFIDGVRLNELCDREHLVIAETGFGTGLNFLLATDYWLQHSEQSSTLTFISTEAFPLASRDLTRAHSAIPQLPGIYEDLQDQWPGPLPGIHRLSFLQNRVRLLLLFGDVLSMLQDQIFAADAWFLDGFAPAKNPQMWSAEVFAEIARLSKPSSRLASFTAAGTVRRGLQAVGFEINKRKGFGDKRHCIRGIMHLVEKPRQSEVPWLRLPEPVLAKNRPSVAIIGAGIAGRSLARQLRQRMFEVTTIAGDTSKPLSGSLLPRALIAPRLVRGSDSYAQFWAQAYVDAIRELERLDDGNLWVGERGLLFRFKDSNQKDLQALKTANAWPQEWIELMSAEQLNDNESGLYFAKSGAIDPRQLFRLLGEDTDVTSDVTAIRQIQKGWALIDEKNQVIIESDIVVIASGTGSSALLNRPEGLRNGSGQLISLSPSDAPQYSVLHDGYLTTPDQQGKIIAGATVNKSKPLDPPEISEQATVEILSRLAGYLGKIDPRDNAFDLQAWAGGRCDTTDHLPIAGPVQDHLRFDDDYQNLFHGVRLSTLPDPAWLSGLYALTGLGARGFQAAFLLADHLASMISGQPLPIGQSSTADLLPCRFQIRHLKRSRPQRK